MQVFSNIHGSHERGRIRRYKPFPPLDIVWYWRTDRMDQRQQFAVLNPDRYFLRFAQVMSHRRVTEEDIARLNAERK